MGCFFHLNVLTKKLMIQLQTHLKTVTKDNTQENCRLNIELTSLMGPEWKLFN